jgi:hypothetical protein
MDPRLEQAVQQAQSKMSQISVNPALQSAQMNALSSLQNEAANGGHTLAQDAYVNQNQAQVNAENAGRQGAIEQQFAERGMGQPSGLMLSAEEQNNQNMTGQENQASMTAAAQAQQNALNALQSAGTQAGQMQAQQFGQAAQVAQAQDAINQFNTQLAAGTQARNVEAENQAQAYNVQEAQNIANENTGLANSQQVYNKQLLEQQYQNELQQAGGAASAYEGEAGQYNNAAQQDSNMWGNIGQGALKAGVGGGQVYANQKNSQNQDSDSEQNPYGDDDDDNF